MEDSILNIIANDNYIILNKSLIKKIGLKESILLGELASEYNYYKNNNMLDDEGYFYSTIENVEENTSLSKYEQKKALDNLEMRTLVITKVKGIPATRHIKFNNQQLVNLLANNLTSSCQKTSKLEVKNFDTNNNKRKIINKNNNINTTYFETKEVNDIFLDFLKMRKKLKAVNSEQAIKLLLNKLNNFDDETKIKMIEQSIEASWKSVFPIKEDREYRKETFSEKIERFDRMVFGD